MPISAYSAIRDNNADIAPGNIRTNDPNQQMIINSIRQLMADLAALGITPFIEGLLNDPTAAAALTTLGVSAYIQTLLDDADAATARATLGVSQAKSTSAPVTLSGTSVDFTGIPAGATRITLGIVGLSFTGAGVPQLQLGDAGGIETVGYLGTNALCSAATIGCTQHPTTAFQWGNGVAAQTYSGGIVLALENAATNMWTVEGNIAYTNGNATNLFAGSKATSAVLDRVRLTSSTGADTFDNGTANISWEF